jgi:hypothetical protein
MKHVIAVLGFGTGFASLTITLYAFIIIILNPYHYVVFSEPVIWIHWLELILMSLGMPCWVWLAMQGLKVVKFGRKKIEI